MPNDKEYEVVVEKIISNGKHGPYAVARSKELDSITFSLDMGVWKENGWPEPGTCVILSKIRRKRAGWRAMHGRFLQPSDENNSQKQQSERSNKR